MSKRVNASADSLAAAVVDVVANRADCNPRDVIVTIEAPGFDDAQPVELEARWSASDGNASGGQPAGDDEQGAAVAEADVADRSDDGEDDGETPSTADDSRTNDDTVSVELLDEEADAAADFLEQVLDILQLPGDLQIRIHDDHAEVEIVGVGGGELIGRRGTTLEALQELLRCSLQRRFERRVNVKMDVEGYRSRRLEKIEQKVEEAVDDVLDSGDAYRLEPMDVFERKAVHQAVAGYSGVISRSQGREPSRRVVIEPED